MINLDLKPELKQMHTVKVHTDEDVREFKVEHGKNVLEFLRENFIEITTPCGGKGICGKCKTKIKGSLSEPTEKEKKLLGNAALDMGYRLACYNKVDADMELFVDNFSNNSANIFILGIENNIKEIDPIVQKIYIEMPEPSITDQRSDVKRIIDSLEINAGLNSLKILKMLPETVRKYKYKITPIIVFNEKNKEIIGIEPGNSSNKLYGIAVDVGTTTIAAYLYDLKSGKKLDEYSMLNPQNKFGADVLSRIDYASSSKKHQQDMHKEITNAINYILDGFVMRNYIKKGDIYLITFVGNTTMMHFLMNLPSKSIAVAPFIPVTTETGLINAKELSININKSGIVAIFPSVSAYIGADTVAGILATGMYKKKEISLLVDIGTNGEIALGNEDRLLACSTAAGPAFEGMNIRNGIGGVKGAIDRVIFDDKLKYTTIGNIKPIGICGSGIVDAVAGMIELGIIDESGRINNADDLTTLNNDYNDYKERLIKYDNMPAFVLVNGKDSATQDDIIITQKDIRELQNAKAAIAAGIKVLSKEYGIKLSDINKVYLAGGFGNYINVRSAFKIGLIPEEIAESKIESVGNTAGSGAILGLLSSKQLQKTIKIKNMIKYIELSASKDFVGEFVNSMFFNC